MTKILRSAARHRTRKTPARRRSRRSLPQRRRRPKVSLPLCPSAPSGSELEPAGPGAHNEPGGCGRCRQLWPPHRGPFEFCKLFCCPLFFVRDVLERQSRKRREGQQASESFCSHHDCYSRTRLKGPPKRPRFLKCSIFLKIAAFWELGTLYVRKFKVR